MATLNILQSTYQNEMINMLGNEGMIRRRGASQSATVIVAASDSLHPGRADYVCPGVDDQTEINAAIDAIADIGYGSLEFMEGTFLPSAKIDLIDNLKLSGTGAGTVFKFDGTATHGLYGRGLSNFEISHLCIDDVLGMGGSGYRGMIDLASSCSKFAVHHTQFKNCAGTVVGLLEDTCQNFKYCDNTFDTCHIPLRACNCDYYQVRNNTFMSLSGAGLGLCCAQYADISGNIFSNSSPGNNRGDIWIGTFYRDSHDLNIHHNIMKTVCGIRFIGDGGNGHYLSRVNVENNIIITTGNGISNPEMSIAPSTSVLSDIIIKDNIIAGSSKGIHFDNYAAMDFTIRDNDFTGCTIEMDIEAGITTDIWRNKGYVTESSGTDTLANGTTFKDVTHGLAVTPTAADITVTPTGTLHAATEFWISGFTSTVFRVNVDADPANVAGIPFAWKAIVL